VERAVDSTVMESFNLFNPSQHLSLPFSVSPTDFTNQRNSHHNEYDSNLNNSPTSLSKVFRGYKSAPVEFVGPSTSDFNLASISNDSIQLQNAQSKVSFHQSVSMENDKQNHYLNEINDERLEETFTLLKSITSTIDATQATNVLLSAIGDIKLLESSAVTNVLIKHISYFSLEKYAEENFLINKRGDRTALERLLSHRSDASHGFLHSRLRNSSLSGVSKGFGSIVGELEACLRLVDNFIGDQPSHNSSSELIHMLLQRIFNVVAPHKINTSISLAGKPIQTQHTHPPHNLQQLFVDEIYAQLCKHTRNNSSKTSTELCWQLFLICLAVFPPSKCILPTLLHHCLLSISSTSFAVRAAKDCIQSIQNTIRRSLPTTVEIQSLLLGEPCEVNVHTMDGNTRQYLVDSYASVSLLEEMIFTSFGVDICVEGNDQGEYVGGMIDRLVAYFDCLILR